MLNKHLVDIVVLIDDTIESLNEGFCLLRIIVKALEEVLFDRLQHVWHEQFFKIQCDNFDQSPSLMTSLHHFSFAFCYTQ